MTVDGTTRRRRARLLLAIAAATAVVGGSLAAGAVTVTVKTTPVAGWSTNGAVYATAIIGDTVYAGGNFTQVRNQGGSQTVARTNLACGAYTLELFGLSCPPPEIAINDFGSSGQGGGTTASGFAPTRVGQPASPVQISWSTAYPEWTMQQASEVTGFFSDWSQPPAIVDGRYAVTNVPSTNHLFFRLRKEP